MPSLKEYTLKLARLRNTRKMTKTMKLVSVNKLRKAREARRVADEFTEQVNRIMARVGGAREPGMHPLLEPRKQVGSVCLVMMTSDRGMCGGFNNALIRRTMQWLQEQKAAGRQVELICCGRRGHTYMRSRATVWKVVEEATQHPSFEHANRIGREVQQLYEGGRFDEVYLAFNRFNNVLSQTPTIDRLLPIDPAALCATAPEADGEKWLFEPTKTAVLEGLLPRLISLNVYAALLNNAVGEHGARMTAMDNATTNADKLIGTLTLLRNRARQAEITTELIEIVAGAEALK